MTQTRLGFSSWLGTQTLTKFRQLIVVWRPDRSEKIKDKEDGSAEIVGWVLKSRSAKYEQLSNWSNRPLRMEQMKYVSNIPLIDTAKLAKSIYNDIDTDNEYNDVYVHFKRDVTFATCQRGYIEGHLKCQQMTVTH